MREQLDVLAAIGMTRRHIDKIAIGKFASCEPVRTH
jgi:hypothetical protein